MAAGPVLGGNSRWLALFGVIDRCTSEGSFAARCSSIRLSSSTCEQLRARLLRGIEVDKGAAGRSRIPDSRRQDDRRDARWESGNRHPSRFFPGRSGATAGVIGGAAGIAEVPERNEGLLAEDVGFDLDRRQSGPSAEEPGPVVWERAFMESGDRLDVLAAGSDHQAADPRPPDDPEALAARLGAADQLHGGQSRRAEVVAARRGCARARAIASACASEHDEGTTTLTPAETTRPVSRSMTAAPKGPPVPRVDVLRREPDRQPHPCLAAPEDIAGCAPGPRANRAARGGASGSGAGPRRRRRDLGSRRLTPGQRHQGAVVDNRDGLGEPHVGQAQGFRRVAGRQAVVGRRIGRLPPQTGRRIVTDPFHIRPKWMPHSQSFFQACGPIPNRAAHREGSMVGGGLPSGQPKAPRPRRTRRTAWARAIWPRNEGCMASWKSSSSSRPRRPIACSSAWPSTRRTGYRAASSR